MGGRETRSALGCVLVAGLAGRSTVRADFQTLIRCHVVSVILQSRSERPCSSEVASLCCEGYTDSLRKSS